jgi:hypothetical protein
MKPTSNLHADVITLGMARFAQLAGGPFDGRCYPLGEHTPAVLHVPVDGSPPSQGAAAVTPRTLRYELRDGLYRFAPDERSAAAA